MIKYYCDICRQEILDTEPSYSVRYEKLTHLSPIALRSYFCQKSGEIIACKQCWNNFIHKKGDKND